MIPPRWTLMRPYSEQHRLWTSTARWRMVAAGRSSGKTELAKRRLVLALAKHVPGCPRPLYFAAGPTHDQMKRVWWEDLKALTPTSWVVNISETQQSITTIFGSTLYLVGLDKPHRIEGNQYAGGVVDESSDIKPGAFDRSIRPALNTYDGWCERIGVPKRFGVGAAEFQAACEHPGPDGASFWWMASEVLTPAQIQSAQDMLGADDYEEQYNARWLSTVGALFSGFSASATVRPCGYNPQERIWVGCDFNVDNMSWVLAHDHDGALDVFDELFLRNTNTQQTLDALWGRYGAAHTGGWAFTGDASSRARRTSASVTDYVTIWNDARFVTAGRVVHVPPANPPVRDRVAATNAMLCSASGARRLHVDPRCVKLLDDLRLRLSVDTNPDRGHMTDALGYLVWHLYPLRANAGGTGQGRVIIHPGPEGRGW